jgi:hypothetical protein
MLEQGPHERAIARQSYQSGQPLPSKIANAPQLFLGLALYIEAFFDLDSERSHGMGLTPIPWTSIASYAIAHELDEEQTHSLFYHIKRLDTEHLKYLAAKQKVTQNAK